MGALYEEAALYGAELNKDRGTCSRRKEIAAEPVIHQARTANLSTGDPGKIYTFFYTLLSGTGGTMESVSDGKADEPAAVVDFATKEKRFRQGRIAKDELVVMNCTGQTYPVEKHVPRDQWRVDLTLSEQSQPAPREGLISVLENLDKKTKTVLILMDLFTVFEELKPVRRAKKIPVIVVSAQDITVESLSVSTGSFKGYTRKDRSQFWCL